MNKYENINLETDELERNRKVYEDINQEHFKKFDINKCVYLNFRNKNNITSFKGYYGDISKNDIVIYDNIINSKIIINMFNNIYKFKWETHLSSHFSPTIFFKTDLIDNLYFQKLFYDVIIPNIDYVNKEKLKIARAYINFHLPLHPGYWHQDFPGYGPTFLVYLNPSWKTEWEGQTAFYKNTKTKDIEYVDFIPGRVVIFKPYIMHRACDMPVYCFKEHVNRFTLAYHSYYEQ